MATKLEKDLRREVSIDGEPWMLTLTPEGLRLVRKGRRKGIELTWKSLVGGDALFAAELRASVDALPDG